MLLCMGFLAPSFCIFISLLPISIPSAAIIMFACALNRQIAPWTLAFYTPALYPSLFKLPSVNFNPSLKDIHLTRPISSSPSLATTSTTTLTLPPSHCQSMEPQNPHHHPPQEDASNLAGCGNGVAGGKTNFLCRQSSTRWIPTSDQIRILRDLYYNNGLRSPNAEQIQRISARLRQYGKIEGKNVFYWFQNHKARERQKKRLTVDIATAANSGFTTKSFPSTSRSPGLYSAGQIGNDVYHGSALAETSFRESCMAAGSVSGNPISAGYWAAASAPDAWVHHGVSDRAANAIISREIETLQLFPINAVKQGGVEEDAEEEEDHGADAEYYRYSGGPSHLLTKDDNKISNMYCCSSQQPEQHQPQHSLYSLNGSTNATTYDVAADSLELTLNSYYGHV